MAISSSVSAFPSNISIYRLYWPQWWCWDRREVYELNKCVCVHLCEKPGKGLVIFGHGRRGAVTACGLRTEGPVFFTQRGQLRGEEWRGEWEVARDGEEHFTVDVLLPCKQFMTYCWLKLNVRSIPCQIQFVPIFWSWVHLAFVDLLICVFQLYVDIWRWNLYFAALDLRIKYWQVKKKKRNIYMDVIQNIPSS